MISPLVQSVYAEAGLMLQPPAKVTVTEWAEREMRLSSEDSAEGGTRYKTLRAPYQRAMQDAVLDPLVEEVVFMTSAQIGKTLILKNVLGFFMREDPSPIVWMVPTLDLAKKVSTQRLAPMFRDVPALANLMESGARKAGNSTLEKSFPGGVLFLVGANSPASLSSMPLRIVLADEVDRYPRSAGPEGDPVMLVAERQATYWNAKRILASTPTIKGDSRIEAAYLASNQNRFWVPCPHCGEYQILRWRRAPKQFNVIWPRGEMPTVENTSYACEICGAALTEFDKPWLLAHGEWRAERPEITNRAGFWLNALCSPFATWAKLAEKFTHASQHRENPELMKTFINLSLAETWEEQAETVSDNELMQRRDSYPPPHLPDGVTVVTAAADVQADRIELLTIGWGKGEEAWFGPWMRFDGDTAKPEVWEKLDKYLLETKFLHARGIRLDIAACLVDSGYHANDVYLWTGPRNERRIYASKGIGGFGRPALQRWNRNNRQRVKMFPVGVDVIKELIYARLKLTTIGSGYMHFSKEWHDAEFFQQLTCEKLVKKYVRGFPVRSWEKQPGARNEALDLTVYAYAAFLSLSANPARMLEDLRKDLLARARQAATERRAKVDPNQLALLDLPQPPEPMTVAEPVKRWHCAQHPEADPDCEVCRAIGDKAEALLHQVKEKLDEKLPPDPGLGVHEYQVAEQVDTNDQDPEPAPVVRVRKSGWI